ncbi:MAG: hypothetical protein KKE93_00625 [Nanoarchaeota archaeon]|nr:hypothetical protein [Nanoarchaeota archaeon]
MEEILPEINIKEKLKVIKDKGFIKSLRKDNTGVGYTLETFLGIKENNIGEPDFTYNGLKVELKAQRKKAGSRVTLSTKSPIWDPLRDRDIINKLGYIDKKGRKALKITLKIDRFNPKEFKLNLDEKEDKLEIVHKSFGIVCYFKFSELIDTIKTKLYENLLLVLADKKKEGEEEYFHYIEANLFSHFDETNFKELLIDGKIVWEFRMHLKESGFARDHGSGLRIGRKYLSNLFKKEEKIL